MLDLVFVMSGSALAARQQALPGTEALDAQVGVLLEPIVRRLQDEGSSLELRPSVGTLDAVSAADLLLACRQVDLDLLPYDDFIAHDDAERQLAAGGS